MSTVNNAVSLPPTVQDRLKLIQDDFEQGDITLKGYCKQRFAVLQSYLDPGTVSAVEVIQNEVLLKKLSENVAYLRIQNLLRLENIETVDPHILRSTENLPSNFIEDIAIAGPSCSKVSKPTLKTPKITQFFRRNEKKVTDKCDSRKKFHSAFRNQTSDFINSGFNDENSVIHNKTTSNNENRGLTNKNTAFNNQNSVLNDENSVIHNKNTSNNENRGLTNKHGAFNNQNSVLNDENSVIHNKNTSNNENRGLTNKHGALSNQNSVFNDVSGIIRNKNTTNNENRGLTNKNSDSYNENIVEITRTTVINTQNSLKSSDTNTKTSFNKNAQIKPKETTKCIHIITNECSNNVKNHKNTVENQLNLETVKHLLTNKETSDTVDTNTIQNHVESIKNNAISSDNNNKRKQSDDVSLEAKKMKREADDRKVFELSVQRHKNRIDRCTVCRQVLNSDVLLYNGHPNGAVEEFIALTDPKLMLFSGDETEVNKDDEMPHNKITHFSVYDKKGHLCPIDTCLIEDNVLLYFSGYLKPIYEESAAAEGGIPAKDLGPINEWWVSGFDGGERALLGFSTAYGQYYLMEPSVEYSPLMKSVTEKIYLSKVVIEFLLNQQYTSATYEDLLDYLHSYISPENLHFSEEKLLRHAQFVCDQVNSYDLAAESADDQLLITTSCMRTLVKLAGVNFAKRRQLRKEETGSRKVKKKSTKIVWTKATTTDLVRKVFESFFPEQLDRSDQVVRRTRCGVCATCQLADCGTCSSCRDKVKYGGRGRHKQACIRRRCPNLAIQDAEDSETEDEDARVLLHESYSTSKQVLHPVQWTSTPVVQHAGRRYYKGALIGAMRVQPGDYVMLHAANAGHPLLIARVAYMFEEQPVGKMFHAQMLCRATDTILGEVADPQELFVVNECDKCPLGAIVRKANVTLKDAGTETADSGECFFYQKKYDRTLGRFEDLDAEIKDENRDYRSCERCKRKLRKKMAETPKLVDNAICWKNEMYKTGSGVYLAPGTFIYKTAPVVATVKQREEPVDEEIYPEYYRKKSDTLTNAQMDCCDPFCIGYIKEVLAKTDEHLQIRVQKLYRSENTHKGVQLSQQLDLNLLYWSEEELIVPFNKVMGRCHLVYGDILDVPAADWSAAGPNRFYFMQTYCAESQEFLPVGESGGMVGKRSKGGKTKNKTTGLVSGSVEEQWPTLPRPLRTMDIFAGCGGLSEGLHQSGVAETLWAIEKEDAAARAFKLNNPDTIVYTDDCNALLARVMAGASHSAAGLPLPPRGAVELMVGGPPCQGFSGMNRFSAGQYSLFKNSLIVSYLSYCDYYRPRYFVLENVRNFTTFKKSTVLKLTLRCLLAMGYQCAFGILQAGNYGVPQSRRRSIILAAAPGEVLPRYPEPMHVFNKRATQLNVVVDNCKYSTGSQWLNVGAPYRTITVRDAMSDLPAVQNGASVQQLQYDSAPVSHFQRLIRSADDSLLHDHICKEMAPIVEARIAHIPTAAGSDWRDLPNIEVPLPDGTRTNKLLYLYHDRKNGKAANGMFRGVCACTSGNRPCDAQDRQYNTLIPWCLPHTANRHNQWAGLYGRLEWEGVFNTTVTNPEPMGKQGRVLHPEQTRVVSVRECARSQGFKDGYRFYGGVLDKYRQIGNAVPPPLGRAVGREIVRALIEGERKQREETLQYKEQSNEYEVLEVAENRKAERRLLMIENAEICKKKQDENAVTPEATEGTALVKTDGNVPMPRLEAVEGTEVTTIPAESQIAQPTIEIIQNPTYISNNQDILELNYLKESKNNKVQKTQLHIEIMKNQEKEERHENDKQNSAESQKNVQQSTQERKKNVQQSTQERKKNDQQNTQENHKNVHQSNEEITDLGINTKVNIKNKIITEEYFDKLMAEQYSLITQFNHNDNELFDVEE